MGATRILPSSYGELETEMGERITAFDTLFQDSIRYYDSLLGSDARSSPGVEQHFLDRFQRLLAQEGFQEPKSLREALIKLSYGFIMKHR
jgi:hypothetical protein